MSKASAAARPPAIMTVLATLGLGGFGLLLLVLFLRALPTAAGLARAGEERQRLLPCEALQPTPATAKLGRLPVAAPTFKLKDFAGTEVELSQLRGNVVLVNFWATWCPPCVAEIPSLTGLLSTMRGKPIRMLAVSVDESWQKVREFFPQGTTLPVLLDSDRKTPELYGTEKFPETFIVDKQGQIRYAVIGDRDWSRPEISECLQRLAAE